MTTDATHPTAITAEDIRAAFTAQDQGDTRTAVDIAAELAAHRAAHRHDTEGLKCCAAATTPWGSTQPFSIVRKTQQGKRYFVATWLPTGCRFSAFRKAEVTAWVRRHEQAGR